MSEEEGGDPAKEASKEASKEAFMRELIAAAERYQGGHLVIVSLAGGGDGRALCRAIEGFEGSTSRVSVYLDCEFGPFGRFGGPYAIEVRELRVGSVIVSAQFSRPATQEEVLEQSIREEQMKEQESDAEAATAGESAGESADESDGGEQVPAVAGDEETF